MRSPRSPALVTLAALAGCDPNAKACHERMTEAQAIVSHVDSKSTASLEQSLSAVTAAHAACERAGLGTEREQLLKAKNEISAQLGLLEQRAARRKLAAPSAEELARLVKQGDPSCPKGQAYKPKNSKSEVRCSGPQLAEMNAEALQAYYAERRFKLVAQKEPAQLEFELGSEKYVYAFKTLDDAAPRCITAYAPPGLSWQEIVARLSGVAPEKLKLDAGVLTARGELALRVEHETDAPIVHLGACSP